MLLISFNQKYKPSLSKFKVLKNNYDWPVSLQKNKKIPIKTALKSHSFIDLDTLNYFGNFL